MPKLRRLLEKSEPLLAPLVWNPLTAKLAVDAGFQALYLGGGSLGYLKCVTEANLSLTEMVQAGVDIRTATNTPLILDGACGWGDPMHLHRTIAMSEAVGFSAIEIEDQIMPKRAHHHVGVEHIVPQELMVAKIKEAIAARKDPDFLIIARTNASRSPGGLDEALRRAEAYRRAGADMLLVMPKDPEEVRIIGERLGAPLQCMAVGGGFSAGDLSKEELYRLGYHLLVDPITPLFAAYETLRNSYAKLASGDKDPVVKTAAHGNAIMSLIHETIDLETMLAVERRTVEKGYS